MMKIVQHTGIFILFSFFFSLPVQAQQWYHIEIVVFEQFSQSSDEASPVFPVLNNASLTPQTSNARMRPASRSKLSGIADRLRNSGGYRVLSHQAWQQTAQSKRSSQPVALSGERLNGQIRIYKGNYLHSELDLWLTDAAGGRGASLTEEGPRYPNLKESRRTRSNEIHYFDHPRLGAVVQVSPTAAP